MTKLTIDRIEQIIAGISQARVAVVGDLMLDRYIWGEVERISPEAPVPVVRLSGESSNLGGAANVAANVIALGAEALLYGVVGDDPEGLQLLDLMQRNKFDTSNVVTATSRSTVVKTRVIAGSQHIVRIDRETVTSLDQGTERKLLVRFRAALDSIHAVVLEDYNKGVLTTHLISEIIAACHSAHIPVGVDPKRENFWSYKGADVFKPNLRELEYAVARPLKSDEDLIAAANEVKERLEIKHLLITRGQEGMALFTAGDIHMIPTQAQRVHDVSGAGDTVIATIMTSLAGGADIFEAATLANCAAGIVIAEVGAVPVDLQKLRDACARIG